MRQKQIQKERIIAMEHRFDKALKILRQLSKAMERFESVQEDICVLEAYYGSDDWKKDYTDDEAGLLPPELKRGVLSEDGIWNLLSENKALKQAINHHPSKRVPL